MENKCGYNCVDCPFKIYNKRKCKINLFYIRRSDDIKNVYKFSDWANKELSILLFCLLYKNMPLNDIPEFLNVKDFNDICDLLFNYLNINKKKIRTQCAYCNKEMIIEFNRYKKYDNVFCNSECKRKYYQKYANYKIYELLPQIKIMCNEANLEYIDIKLEGKRSDRSKIVYKCNLHPNKGVQTCLLPTLQHMSKNKHCNCMLKKYELDDLINSKNLPNNIQIIGEYINDSTPILCKCLNCGNKWSISPNKIKHGRNCPECNKKKGKYTKGEMGIMEWLDIYNIGYIPQCKLYNCKNQIHLKFDFYIPEENLVIEYQGEQHYFPVTFGGRSIDEAKMDFNKTVFRDRIKKEYCKEHNIKFVEIPYYEKDKIHIILSELLL